MSKQCKIDFIRGELTGIILKKLNRSDDELLEVKLSTPEHLDGFMSVIHNLILVTKDKKTSETKSFNLMVKVMKGDDAFRESSLAKTQFTNEIYIYTKVVPAFIDLLATKQCSIRGENWCPKIVYGTSGQIPGFSDIYETILVMENMTLDGFQAGPRNDLDEHHLALMAKRIAQFHACTYAMKILDKERLETLVDGIIPLNFAKDGQTFNSYAVLFKLGLDRVFEYIDNHSAELDDKNFRTDMTKLRRKYGEKPIHLMQKFLERTEFSVILHGDYNRNNVLFKYEDDKPIDLRMFDFQENRYGSPSVDLTFFMCMSMPTGCREKFWTPTLKHYHDSLIETMIDILKCDKDDPRLLTYNYDNFISHITKFGLYGGMVAAHFLPWMMCPEDECAQLSFHFEKDVHSSEFKHWTRVCGGEAVDKRLIEIFKHLSQLGYFSIVDDD